MPFLPKGAGFLEIEVYFFFLIYCIFTIQLKYLYLIMTTLTIHSISDEQDTAIRVFLDTLHVDYMVSKEFDDATSFLSSSANAEHLQKSIEQEKTGEVTKLGLDDIWKL